MLSAAVLAEGVQATLTSTTEAMDAPYGRLTCPGTYVWEKRMATAKSARVPTVEAVSSSTRRPTCSGKVQICEQ